jgi:LPPG:FO 2-phospho-L-lactate transferase
VALKVVALSGGVGGAKLCDGLAGAVAAQDLTIIVNTGDDFEHLGLWICPDLDTVVYTLAGVANPERGWGRAEESWNFLRELERLGGPSWFRIGDRDLAFHHRRKQLLDSGMRLSEATADLCRKLGVRVAVLPMSDERVGTLVLTEAGAMPFQHYFVARGCEPAVCGFQFQGIEGAEPAPGVLAALGEAGLVVLCPSNPWVSLDPILAVPGISQALGGKMVIGVSPLVGGKALKGPAAKMYREMGMPPTALSVAGQYRGLLSGFVIDQIDREASGKIEELGLKVCVTDTIMKSERHRLQLAEDVLAFGARIREVDE